MIEDNVCNYVEAVVI